MKKQLLTMILAVLFIQATAQKKMRYDTVSAYIVTLAHDTVQGYLQLTLMGNNYTSEDWYKKIYFIDSNKQKTKYESSDILGYGFALDTARNFTFRSKEITIPNKAGFIRGHGVKFVMVEVSGAINLYRFYHEEVGPGMVGWYNERYLQKGEGSLVLLKRDNLKSKYKLDQTYDWFTEYPESVDYLAKELSANELYKLVFAYNSWKASQPTVPLN